MSTTDMRELGAEISLPEINFITHEELAHDFLPAAAAGLSDGDLGALHPPYTGPEKVRLYGEYMFNHGEVAKRLHQAAIATANRPSAVYDFQGFVANYCDMPESPFYKETTRQNISIYPEIVTLDDNPISLRKSPGVVVDYTACLSSRSLLRNQLAFAETDQKMFSYVAITRMHFTNLMLMQAYDKHFGPGVADLMINNRFYTGREDGIASATDEIITAQSEAGAPVEIADIILCNGGQHTTREDLKKGTANAFTMAKEEGLFIIRSFAKPSSEEIGTDEIAEWAFEAGFQEQTALEYDAVAHSPGAAILRHQDAARTLKTLVLAK